MIGLRKPGAALATVFLFAACATVTPESQKDAGGGTTDAGSADAVTTDAVTTDVGTTDAGMPDVVTTDTETTDVEMTDAVVTDVGATDGATVDTWIADSGEQDAAPEVCGDGLSNDDDLEVDEGCVPCQGASFAEAEHRQEAAPPPVFTAGLIEASGIVASRANPGVLWTHNDNSGDRNIFAIDTQGTYLGRYTLDFGPAGSDPEDIAAGPGPDGTGDWLYFGDTGSNAQTRNRLLIRWVAEPVVSLGQVPVTETISTGEILYLTYPDGETYDAETLLVDPDSKDLFVLTKRVSSPKIFRAPYPLSTTEDNVMIYEGEVTWGDSSLTGGEISPDGSQIALTRYGASRHWFRTAGSTVAETLTASSGAALPKAAEEQGEAICFDYQSYNIFTISEWAGGAWETPDADKDLHFYARVCP